MWRRRLRSICAMTRANDVAIVTPVGCGHAELVSEAVASVFQQGATLPKEMVVVDDSAEPPVNLPDQPDLRVVRITPPPCRSRARNIGVSLTNTPWLYFLDADDWLEPTAIGDFAQILVEHPDVQIVWANYHHSVSWKGRARLCAQKPFSRDRMRVKNQAHIGLFVLRERFDAIGGFDESLEIGEDRDFFSRYLLNPKIRFHKHTRPFVKIRRGKHALPNAGRLYGTAMERINKMFAEGYYDRWASR